MHGRRMTITLAIILLVVTAWTVSAELAGVDKAPAPTDEIGSKELHREAYLKCFPMNERETAHIIMTNEGGYVCSLTRYVNGSYKVVRPRYELTSL